MFQFLNNLFEKHKFVRRATLAWACWLITVVVLRVTEPEVLKDVNGSVATIVGSVIGILATVIGFYHKTRKQEDERLNDH